MAKTSFFLPSILLLSLLVIAAATDFGHFPSSEPGRPNYAYSQNEKPTEDDSNTEYPKPDPLDVKVKTGLNVEYDPKPEYESPKEPSEEYVPKTEAPKEPSDDYTPKPEPEAPEKPSAAYTPKPEPEAPKKPSDDYSPKPEPEAPKKPCDDYTLKPEPKTPKNPNDDYTLKPEPKTPKNPSDDYTPEPEPKTPKNPSDDYTPEPEPKTSKNPSDDYTPEPEPKTPKNPSDDYTPKPEPKTPSDDYTPKPEPKTPQNPSDDYTPKPEPKTPKNPSDDYTPKPEPKTPKNPSNDYTPKPELEPESPLPIGIEGLVLCKSGSKYTPIKGAVARITCSILGHEGYETTPFSCLTSETDEKGFFFKILPDLGFHKLLMLTDCKVKLEKSPLGTCKIPTNVNMGITGALLSSYQILHDKKIKLYPVGPFFYTSESISTPAGY